LNTKYRYFLGLGGNLGDVSASFRESLKALRSEGFEILVLSNVYKSSALQLTGSKTKQADYLNAVIEVSCEYEPLQVLSMVKVIEVDLGRIDGERWGPRPIDIDIIAGFADSSLVYSSKELKIPHAEMQNRLFVLFPLQEIAEDWEHPVLNLKIDILIQNLIDIVKQDDSGDSMFCEIHSPFPDYES